MKYFTINPLLFLVCILTFCITSLKSQNLVVNPSFELTNTNCSGIAGEGFRQDLNPSWDNANSNIAGDSCSSPDLFSACNIAFTSMPGGGFGSLGYQYSRTGTRHAGFIAYSAPFGFADNYREYIQGHTTAPLVGGQTYCVSMYVSLADGSPWAVKELGVYFSNTQYLRDACNQGSGIYVTPQLENTCGIISDTTYKWVRLQWDYVASGGEQYFVIGNFHNDAGTTKVSTGSSSFSNTFAYYFVDDVSIVANSCCFADITKVNTQCLTGSAFTMTATPGIGTTCTQSVNGTWSGTGITNSTTGVFNPSVAGSGVHTISLTLSCGYTATTSIAVSPCALLNVCKETNGSITVSNGVAPYTWSTYVPPTSSPITNQAQCQACGYNWIGFPLNQCLNGVTAVTSCTTAAFWQVFATGTNVAVPSNTATIKIVDGSGTTLTFTPSAVLACTTTASCPTLTLSVLSQTNINCFGANTGSATVSANGGTGAYTYTWAPGNLIGASQTGLSAGTYTISIRDVNQCPGTGTITITQPTAALTAVISATTAAGCGSSTSTAIFWTENFGVGCSQNQIANGTNPSVNGVWTVTNTGTNDASANQWFISATESGMGVGNCGDGCLGSGGNNRTLHVSNLPTSPAAFIFCPTGDCGAAYDTGFGSNAVRADKRAESPTINCSGQSNITLSFNYIEGGQTTIDDATLWYFDGTTWAQIDNMPKTTVCGAGQGLWASRTMTLPASANNNPNIKIGYRWVNNDDGVGTDPSFAVDDITLSATSSGSAGGSATVTASGGTPAYNYIWTPSGITTAVASGLTAATHTVVVTDSKGCIANAIANITSTGGPTLTVTSQLNVNCFAATTGTATVNGNGGTGPYSYIWSPGNLSGTSQTTLSAGVYTINVQDANQCVGSNTLSISQPTAALNAVISNTTAAGCGASTGGATVTASGGTPSYTYSWSAGGGTTSGVSNLPVGSNTVIVTDSKGCISSAIVTITSFGGPVLSVSSQTNVNCFGSNTGGAIINASGGVGPYSYTWSPGNLSGTTQTSLSAGTYTINVSDANLCAGTGTLLITQPTTSLSVNIANSPTGCGTSVGSATATASGGTLSYNYTWSSPIIAIGNIASNLATGTYSVLVTDNNGCQASAVTVITSGGSGPGLSVTSQSNILCHGASTGSAAVTAVGTPGPFSYTWSPSGGNASVASALTAGVYTVTVSDGSACTSTISVSISQPSAITSSLVITAASCGSSDGAATINTSGGTGSLTILWQTGSSNNSITGLAPGSYSVVITDANSCSVIANAIVGSSGGLAVDAGVGSTIFAGESTQLTATVPSGATVVWSPAGSLSCPACPITSASPIVTTTYTITTNLGGCIGIDTVTVIVDILCGELYIPTAFSPNDDGQNDILYVMGNCITNLQFAIFDRWGEKVFETTDPANGWDGTFNGKKLNPAGFAYYLKATVKGEDVSKKGNISIVK